MRSARALLPALLVTTLVLPACATVSAGSERYIGGPVFAPTDPASVELLRREPKRPHVQIGEVFLSPSRGAGVADLEKALRQEAAKLGAHAAVVVHDRTRRVGTVVSGGWWVRHARPVYARNIVAVAIRYPER